MVASARVASLPSTAALTSRFASATSALTLSMQLFRLFLISLKSPLYLSVILGGMSPFEIRSTYSAATFSGPITASSVWLTPSTILRKSPPMLGRVGASGEFAFHGRLDQQVRRRPPAR